MIATVKHSLKVTLALLSSRRYCPLCCNLVARFEPFGVIPRENAKCPHCDCVERHRLVWSYFVRCTNLFDGTRKRVLHVAPEKQIRRKLSRVPYLDYTTADLDGRRVDEQMDITDIRHPDSSFDVIYCSHVLEHVPDDRRAMREFFRVLKPGGWAILLVPMSNEPTLENPDVTDPQERERLFGQCDHVRRYGPDFLDRLREGGFQVRLLQPHEIVGRHNVKRFGVQQCEANRGIVFCMKVDRLLDGDAGGEKRSC